MTNDSRSLTASTRSGTEGSKVAGQMSSPTPSTRYGRPVPPEYTEPCGSAPTTVTRPPLTSLRYFPVPQIVPPVPMPATNAVIRPPVCSHSSGPVLW